MGAKVTASLCWPFQQLAAAWDRFWFTPADPFNTCVIRLLAGGMIVYTHFIWGTRLDEFFSDEGWNSREYLSHVQAGTYTWSFWWYVPDGWKPIVHWLCMLVLIGFFVGLWTRVTSVLTWLIAVAYSTRSALSNYGLDQINCILLMYLMLAPCGHYLSVDWWLRRRKQQPDPPPSVLANVSMRLVQLHLCVIYMWAGLGKLQGEAWWDGRAMWQALASYEYQSLDLTFLAAYPAVLNFLTHLTIAWEVYFPALVCNRILRPFALLLGVGMHFGIGAFLGMWTFGTAMTFGYLTFVPPQRLREFLGRLLPAACAAQPTLGDVPEQSQTTDAASQPTSQPRPIPGVPGVAPWFATAAASTSKTELVPFQGALPNVVLVVRGATNFKSLTNYFQHHAVRLLIVDGLAEAGALASVNRETVIVDVDAKLSETELNVFCQWIRQQNPQTRFVFVGQSPQFRNDDPGTIIVERNCSLRQIRTAVEELTGCTCERLTPATAAEDETRSESSSLKPLTMLSTWLLVACTIFMSGCGQEPSSRMLFEKVRLLNDNNRTDEALSVIDQILRREPQHPDALYQRGFAYEQSANYEKAIEAYTECLKVAPDFAEALNNRGIVYGLMGQTEKSFDDIKAATLAKPDVSLFWANLGLVQCKLGQYDQALESYERAQYRNNDYRLEFQRANILLCAARFAEAEAAYTRVLDQDKGHTAARLNRAHARHQLGQSELAAEDLDAVAIYDTEFSLAPHINSLRAAIESSGQ